LPGNKSAENAHAFLFASIRTTLEELTTMAKTAAKAKKAPVKQAPAKPAPATKPAAKKPAAKPAPKKPVGKKDKAAA
jgi:hypothetical protein